MPENNSVLIVEDNPASQSLIEKIVGRAGFETMCVNNGREALEIMDEKFFPIVITDWVMPEIDGLQLCKAIRSKPAKGYVFILLVTARDSLLDIITGLETGADEYIIKPINPLELAARLKTAQRIIKLETCLKAANKQLLQEIDRLHSAEKELQNARGDLQIKVRQRTEELARINDQLLRELDERKSIEHQMEDALLSAESALKVKTEFLTNMSHEIRTPLYGITGMIEVVRETELTREQQDILNTINSEAGALLRIVNEVLDFSKLGAGKFLLDPIAFDLNYLINEFKTSFEILAVKKGLGFNCAGLFDFKFELIGDPGRLRQVLTNLAGNALKFTHHGEITINVEPVEETNHQIKFLFEIKDTGIGIPEDKHELIFEDFTQADGSTTREYGGTGLGISISKKIVELMGGEIGVKSKEAQGSTFWFTAVFLKQDINEQKIEIHNVEIEDITVLLINERQFHESWVKNSLNSFGCQVMEDPRKLTTMSRMTEKELFKYPLDFDLMVIDAHSQVRYAFSLVEKIRFQPRYQKIPVVVLSTQGHQGDGQRCKTLGIEGYLTGSFDSMDLQRCIKMILGGHVLNGLITRHSLAEIQRRNIRVLLVEDYPTSQQLGKRYLKDAGYEVDVAENGCRAINAWENNSYDMILMDIQMPVMDGLEATKMIREMEEGTSKRVPVIAMTAHAIKGYREKCIEAGMDDYITKPLGKKNLQDIVMKWILFSNYSGKDRKNIDNYAQAHNINVREIPEDNGPEFFVDNDLPMCFNGAMAEFGHDREFLLSVIDSFIAKVKTQIESMKKYLKNKDSESLAKEAHSIKGGAAELFAGNLSKFAAKLEEVAGAGNLNQAEGLINNIEEILLSLENFIGAK